MSTNGCDRAPAGERGNANELERAGRVPLVEIDGCPNHEPAVALVQRLSRELGIEPELR